ncbi:MAG TPA: glycosyltransferase family A protein [Pedobacter sp.]|nr:glycosyltransferase family A protein [Pedobacter sp.]
MPVLSLPNWIKPHLYAGKKFKDLTDDELLNLQRNIARFKHDDPEVSVMIPAWNEENNIFRTLSSLSATSSKLKIEIVVINNNSTDGLQNVLDILGVKSMFQPQQGTSFARQMGLLQAKGKYHLCADSDTFYPPSWIDLMVEPMKTEAGCVGVYGRYYFIPGQGETRFFYSIYEKLTGVLVQLKKKKREHINVLGFNMGFITQVGIDNGGFEVTQTRMFDNARGSEYFVDEAEDGRMALNLKKTGWLKLVRAPKARVFTSSRRLAAEGGIVRSFINRFKLHTRRFKEYITGPKV